MARQRPCEVGIKLEREREAGEDILVLLAQALLNGSFGLAHEAAVADCCCCLAVCCSDMQDFTMCSQRERETEIQTEQQREREMKGRAGKPLRG